MPKFLSDDLLQRLHALKMENTVIFSKEENLRFYSFSRFKNSAEYDEYVRKATHRGELNAIILQDPPTALYTLALNTFLQLDQVEVILNSGNYYFQRNLWARPIFIVNNPTTPIRFLDYWATESNHRRLLKAIAVHPNASEETRVLAAMRAAILPDNERTESVLP